MFLFAGSNHSLRLLVALVLTAFSGLDAQTPTLRERADALDAPALGAALDLGGTIAIPQGELQLEAGTKVYPLVVDGHLNGFYVAGPAVLVFRVGDRFSAEVARRNLDRAADLKFVDQGQGLEVREEVREVVIWSDQWLQQAVVADPSRTFPVWATSYLERSFYDPPSVLLLGHRGLGVKGAFYLLADGVHEDLLLRRDPAITGLDELFRLEKVEIRDKAVDGRPGAQRLASLPIQRQWWERFPAALIAEHESLNVENPAGEKVLVRSVSTLRATTGNVGLWQVPLVSELTNFDNKLRPVQISKVAVDGKAADYLHRNHELLVELPRALGRGEKVLVEVELQADFADRPGGDNFFSLGTWPWYPQPPLNGELATVDITVKVPDALVPFASGKVLERTKADGFNVVKTQVAVPVQFPVVAAGNYKLYSDTQDGVTCHVATYGVGKEAGARRLIKNFFAARKFYEELFDVPYPFEEFTIVEVNSWGFGQAPPGMIFLTKEALANYAGAEEGSVDQILGRITSKDLNQRFVHEVAHAWWGHVAKMDSPEETWISESFAQYASAMCLRAMYGGKKGDQAFKNYVLEWQGTSSEVKKGASVYLASYLAGEGMLDFQARTLLLYGKGATVVHAIREQLRRDLGGDQEGDRAFVAFLRSVLKNFRFQWANTRHLPTILQQISGKDWQPFFERHIYGTERPALELR